MRSEIQLIYLTALQVVFTDNTPRITGTDIYAKFIIEEDHPEKRLDCQLFQYTNFGFIDTTVTPPIEDCKL